MSNAIIFRPVVSPTVIGITTTVPLAAFTVGNATVTGGVPDAVAVAVAVAVCDIAIVGVFVGVAVLVRVAVAVAVFVDVAVAVAVGVGVLVLVLVAVLVAVAVFVFVGPGDVADIPPGHDGWVIGNEPAILYQFNCKTDQK